tara:strand:+ start:578 stop:2971 length:2394 start_codon:yes stop_codon:yes gene_type:complete
MTEDNKNIPSDDIASSLKTIGKFIDQEDTAVRQRQIRQWRQLKYYWNGLNNIWWNDVAHDWQVFGQESTNDEFGDAAFYDKRINVLRAYLESIISALSITIPTIKCAPDDADSPLDSSTAKAGEKIASLVRRHNDDAYLWLHALYIYATEGLVFSYTYPKEDVKFGTYDEPIHKDFTEQAHQCPECGAQLPEEMFASQELNEFDPDNDDAQLHAMLTQGEIPCPQCDALLDPALQKTPFVVTRLVGNKTLPKSRICIEVYGGLYVKIPNYVSRIEDTPYLQYSYETAYVNVRERYQHIRDKDFAAKNIGPSSQGGVYDPYERWGRLSTQYLGEYPTNTVTVRNVWLRPSAYHYITDEDKLSELLDKYPDGCKVVFINDEVVEAFNESLDDHWSCIKNPLSDYLHFQPLGMLLTSVQDITNEIISLTLQTIEHGIPQTFVDPGVVNFKEYRQMETTPGALIPATPKSGKSLSDAFHEVKTAMLSQEVLPFGQEMQQLGQLASGALPSLFGGAQPNSSKTASQYLTSKNQAQQRLQTSWKMMCSWWKDTFAKVIPMYIKEVVEDEKFVTKDPTTGNYVNVFIRKAELSGKIGNIELEAAENLPISWMQKKDTIMQFLQAASPEIMSALVDPQNLPIIAEAVGLENLTLPGANDRELQLEEIVQLINSTPIPNPQMAMDPMTGEPVLDEMGQPMMGEMLEEPSVPIEPDVDNHDIHIQIARNWLTSEAGRLAKQENPEGYKNVLLHMKAHVQFVQQQQMQQMMMQGMQGGNPNGEGPPTGKPGNDKVMAPAKDQMHETTS